MEEKPGAKHAVLTEQLGAGMDALEALAQERRTQDQDKLVHARKNVQPLVDRAGELKAEFEGLLKDFGPYLDRLAQLDMATLRTFSGHNILGSIDKDALEVKAYLAQAIQVLGRIPTEPEKFTVEGVHGQVERMRHDVEFFTGGPSRMVDKVRDFQGRMSRFEEALKR